MSGRGSTYAGFDAGNYGASASSIFSISFEVDQLTDFSLTGSLDSNLFDTYNPDSMLTPFSYAGQFNTGNSYQLILSSSSYNLDYYSEEWKFKLETTSAIPVPAAFWLFGSGLILLAGVVKRKSSLNV